MVKKFDVYNVRIDNEHYVLVEVIVDMKFDSGYLERIALQHRVSTTNGRSVLMAEKVVNGTYNFNNGCFRIQSALELETYCIDAGIRIKDIYSHQYLNTQSKVK